MGGIRRCEIPKYHLLEHLAIGTSVLGDGYSNQRVIHHALYCHLSSSVLSLMMLVPYLITPVPSLIALCFLDRLRFFLPGTALSTYQCSANREFLYPRNSSRHLSVPCPSWFFPLRYSTWHSSMLCRPWFSYIISFLWFFNSNCVFSSLD